MKCFWIFICFLFLGLGCGEEHFIAFDLLGDPESDANVISPPPSEIQALLFDRFGSREDLLDKLVVLDWDDPMVDAEFMANWYIRAIADMDQQYLYYDKYVDAGGVAILANEIVPDAHLLAAKAIVLKMTAKHPVIREQLSPSGKYPHYHVLVPWTGRELPEFRLDPASGNYAGMCSYFCYAAVRGDADNFSMRTFVHEFAHAIHRAIRELDPTFDDRLKAAYNAAMDAGLWQSSYAATHYHEYWAVGVEYWYYLSRSPIKFASRAEFAEYDPSLYKLLSEWFEVGDFSEAFGFGL